jgi:hypothetical protein
VARGRRNSPRYKYGAHRRSAKERGIPFLITFEDWDTIWQLSGKWEQRGNRKGQYVMSRPGDKGAYEMGNVVICLAEENRAERNRNYPHTGKKPWVSARTKGTTLSAATRIKMSEVKLGRKRDSCGRWLDREEA